MNDRYAIGEVDFSFDDAAAQVGLAAEAGLWPETTRIFGLAEGATGNADRAPVPCDAPAKAAAMVVHGGPFRAGLGLVRLRS